MNKMKITSKRCFALLLALVMCLGMFQMTAFADEGEQHEGTPVVTETPDEKQESAQETINVDTEDDGDADEEKTIDTTPSVPVDGNDAGQLAGGNKAPAKHRHTWELKSTTPATCKDNAIKHYVCSCGATDDSEVLGSHLKVDHTWSDEIKVTAEPKCLSTGIGYHYCTVCGDKDMLHPVTIDALGHDFKVTKDAVDLGSIGEYDTDIRHTVKCTRCGVYETRLHSYNGATCKTPGVCVCGKVDPDEKLNPDNHANVVTDAAVTATCTTDGKTAGSHCAACGTVIKEQEEIKATGHDFSGAINSVDEKQHETKCNNCSATEKQDHAFDVTVTVDGNKEVTTYSCKACGDSYKEEKDAECKHEHFHEEITDTTCQVQGHYKLICDDCKKVLKEHDCPKVDHEYIGGKCKYCGKCENIDEKTGCHAVDKIVHPATCTEDGYVEYKCPICGYTMPNEKTEDALGHIPGELVVVNNPTCTEKGNSIQYCARCNEVIDNPSTPALGHNFPDVWSDDCATGNHTDECKSDSHIRKCTRCNGTEPDGELREPHSYGDWTVTKKATATERGEQKRWCTTCSHVERQEIPALGEVTITIEYKDGENTVKTETVVVTKGSEYDVTNEIKIPDGYERDGNPDNVSGTADDNKTVTVPVKKIVYTVTFDANGGSAVASQTVKHGETATNPTTTRSNYTFNGWTLNGAAYNFSTPVTGDITLVARWEYNGSGGGIIVTPTPPDEPDDPVDIPDEPTPGGDQPDEPNEPDDPGVDIPDEPVPGGGEPEDPNEPDDPIVDITDPDVPTTDRPVNPNRPTTPTRPTDSSELTEIVDEEVPLADTPETGDNVWVWYLTALLSAAGIAVLAVLENKKRAKR